MAILIRKLTSSDIEPCIQLFHDTVHAVNSKDYTPEQLNIWAPKSVNPNDPQWRSLLKNISLVAELNNVLVGFIDMSHAGYLDRLYVHKDHQHAGVATALLLELEQQAKNQCITEITTEASITAKPFFEKMGFQICHKQQKIFNGINFTNYVMKKKTI